MDFLANGPDAVASMLAELGLENLQELFAEIPQELLVEAPYHDDGLSEWEAREELARLADKNRFHRMQSYMGCGAYSHQIPAIVPAICAKSEFLTSYTPYQAEASQGMLQVIFEFQSAIAALTGLDVANASVYDGASACAEACLMALRVKKGRNKIVLRGLLPNYREVVEGYIAPHDTEIVESVGEDVAALLVQSPNLYGHIEDVAALAAEAKRAGVLTILVANPLAYGLYPSAKELGAEIAVGDVQPLGVPLQFGGPYAGYMACEKSLVRQMPGRIAGATVDREGRPGFVLTLQAREQHIRREKATSNICTNQALVALAALVTILWYGKEGLQKLALTNFQRASYLRENLRNIPGISVDDRPIFNEFPVRFTKPIEEVMRGFIEHEIVPGVPLDDSLVVAVTEIKERKMLDRYVEVAREVAGG